jgi:uncharacterized protein
MLNLAIEPCIYPVWATGGHNQTILGHLLPSPTLKTSGTKIVIDLPDGDTMIGKYYKGTSDTVIYLFHGLSGDIDADYMQRTAILCQRFGHSVVMVNHRGAGSGHGLASKPYHSGSYHDLAAVFSFGRKTFKKKHHGAIGFSMSGNILLLLLAQAGLSKPDFALTVNAPINLEKAAYNLKVGLNRLYDFRFVQRLRDEVKERMDLGLIKEKYSIPRTGTVMEFDEIYTAPAAGFASRDHYYTACSAKKFLSKIRIPTVLITAKDDPFIDWEDYMDTKLSPHVHFHLENCGGHLGYLSKRNTPLGTHRWLDYILWTYMEEMRTQLREIAPRRASIEAMA